MYYQLRHFPGLAVCGRRFGRSSGYVRRHTARNLQGAERHPEELPAAQNASSIGQALPVLLVLFAYLLLGPFVELLLLNGA